MTCEFGHVCSVMKGIKLLGWTMLNFLWATSPARGKNPNYDVYFPIKFRIQVTRCPHVPEHVHFLRSKNESGFYFILLVPQTCLHQICIAILCVFDKVALAPSPTLFFTTSDHPNRRPRRWPTTSGAAAALVCMGMVAQGEQHPS